MTEPRLWAIVGATGTGKTALSFDLARELLRRRGVHAEIVNADSMQFYRGMDIGTAKAPVEHRRQIPHHLFDVLDLTEEAAVAWYQPLAREVIAQIHGRGNDAIVVGGSGLYVSSLLFEFQFPARDEGVRRRLEEQAEQMGIDALIDRLRELDADMAAAVDIRNPRRVIRALEVAELGGTARVSLPSAPELWRENTTILGLNTDRPTLVARLDNRVEQMWQEGLLDEVRALRELGLEHGKTASRAIGYSQALSQLRGELSEAEAIEQTKVLTRRYARRQVSWFKRYADVQWLTTPSALEIEGL